MAQQAEATMGMLSLPHPDKFVGNATGGAEYEEFRVFYVKLKGFLPLQNPRFRALMEAAERSPDPIYANEEQDQKLGVVLKACWRC